MGGYGGALKTTFNWLCIILWKSVYPWSRGTCKKIWTAEHDLFLESMADAAKISP